MLVSLHCAGENNKHTLYVRIYPDPVPDCTLWVLYTEMESGPRSVTVVLVKVGRHPSDALPLGASFLGKNLHTHT